MKIQHICLALGLTTIGSATSIFSPIATLPVKALTWNLSNVKPDISRNALERKAISHLME